MTAEQRHERRRIATNSAWNLLGNVLPLAAGVLCIPQLIARIGPDRFGVLSFVWLIVGYFGVLDLGMGVAITRLVARHRRHFDAEITSTVAFLIGALTAVGVFTGSAMFLAAPMISGALLRTPDSLDAEAVTTLRIMALTFPVVLCSSGLRGILEGLQEFLPVNLVKVWLGCLSFLGPLLASSWNHSLVAVVTAVAIVRLSAAILYLVLCVRRIESTISVRAVDPTKVRELLRFGGWLTISNVLGPVLGAADRFMIGSIVSTSALAYYSTPYEIVGRLGVVSVAVCSALFPVFAQQVHESRAQVSALLRDGVWTIVSLLFVPTLMIVSFPRELLGLWLGPEFAARSHTILQCLVLAVGLSSTAQVFVIFHQAGGRPHVLALLNLAEIPISAVGLLLLIRSYGAPGAAVYMVVRNALYLASLGWLATRHLPGLFRPSQRILGILFTAGTILLLAASAPQMWVRLAICSGVLCMYAVWALRSPAVRRLVIASRPAAMAESANVE